MDVRDQGHQLVDENIGNENMDVELRLTNRTTSSMPNDEESDRS